MNTSPDNLFDLSNDPAIVEDESLSLKLWPNFVPAAEGRELFRVLMAESPWRETELQMFGKRIKMPRLTCWYGDADAVYTYSGIRNEPLPWTDCLNHMAERVRQVTGAEFNSVLLNLYRDGNDSMAWHSDDERELGPSPVIASVSLGATRKFNFRKAKAQAGAPRATRSIELTDGSLLQMHGDTQRDWQHGIPKAPQVTEPRINLTFRRVIVRPSQR